VPQRVSEMTFCVELDVKA